MADIIVREAADRSAKTLGLDRHNRSILPGCTQKFQASVGRNRRYVTGLDEESLAINSIRDPEERRKKQDEVRARREKLEQVTGYKLTSEIGNEFWQRYWFELKNNLHINLANPEDEILYHVALANRYLAPDKETTNDPDYTNTKFYASREAEEIINKTLSKRERNSAIAELEKLYSTKNKNRLFLVGFSLLDTYVKSLMSEDQLYNILSDYLDTNKAENFSKFLTASGKTTEQLETERLITVAIKNDLIIKRAGEYHYEGEVVGKTYADVVVNMQKSKNSSKILAIKDSLEFNRHI